MALAQVTHTCSNPFQVRGTPGSGKSTLAQLLADYIKAREPGVDPVVIGNWPEKTSAIKWEEYLDERGYEVHLPLIIDEAQLTYWDREFWNGLLKPITTDPEKSPCRVILFVSYGSARNNLDEELRGTPMALENAQRIDLQAVDYRDKCGSAGLFLTKEEFDDVAKISFPKNRFSAQFLENIFNSTAGHTGAVNDMLDIALKSSVSLQHRIGAFTHNLSKEYRDLKLKNNGEKYSDDHFWKEFNHKKLWESLQAGGRVFKRGLPAPDQLGDAHIARVFRKVLCDKSVKEKDFDKGEERTALKRCWKKGWLHAIGDGPNYIFTTGLHELYLAHYLEPKGLDITAAASYHDLPTFVFHVIKRFSPNQLSPNERLGPANIVRPQEAQYQDEFYCCCLDYTDKAIKTLSEFGNRKGRIDFYIPSKKWGVELLREGDRLEGHSSRFYGEGAYVDMQFDDYIIIDCRTTKPLKPHPGQSTILFVSFYVSSNFRLQVYLNSITLCLGITTNMEKSSMGPHCSLLTKNLHSKIIPDLMM